LTEEMPFTVADFVLCDRRYAAHFARVPRDRWNDQMIPADEWLAREDKDSDDDRLPYVLAVDGNDALQRVIVDARLMQLAARCRTFWHRLQEQGGIHNSHAEILLAREKAKWEEARARELDTLKASGRGDTRRGRRRSRRRCALRVRRARLRCPRAQSDEAWIETTRCPSCNECQNINDRMFTYNENKQAYIVDVKLGTYRQLVEAAEACQVAIIHPGKPWNPDEPDLEALVARAAAFQ
jgi:ferredoxin